MAQSPDFVVDDGTGVLLLSQLNTMFAALASSNSGNTEPPLPYAGMFWFDTNSTPAVMKRRNSANNAWNKVNPGTTITTRTSGYTVTEADRFTASRCTASLTLAFQSAATLGSDWSTIVYADGGTVTLDPDGSETINGVATQTLRDGEWGIVFSDGSNLFLTLVPRATSRKPDFILENRQASGVGGGSLSVGTNTLVLNTEVRDSSGIVSLLSSEFTVTEDCYIEWAFPIYDSNQARTSLYSVTDAATVAEADAMGMNIWARSASINVENVSHGWGLLESGKTYRIECYAASSGLQGLGATTGDPERFGFVKGWID
ncbi:hypothetical protein [uncultured Ruegeria sp.]|uniref:hypothetical protein n=1 Tax=uncultured Ruegeria sp. TaxID=259304 RepID=UPI002617307C|nr:hypothetical protein [uncultured Ruegeria sp.]